MKIVSKAEIASHLPSLTELMAALKQGYIDYSDKQYDIPPVGYLALPHGELHLKYGLGKNAAFAVIKIAAGSYTNPQKGLPSSSGCLVVIDAETGFPVALLQDEGLLTDLRTSAAGALMATKCAPLAEIMGVVGCGIQGYYQALHTCEALGIHQVIAYDLHTDAIAKLAQQLAQHDILVTPAKSIEALCQQADIITTVTPSKQPYLDANWLKPNVHINAFGCDSIGKRELKENLLVDAKTILADSVSQCHDHGELQYANQATINKVMEFGSALKQGHLLPHEGISLADFTGVAVQDIVIASLVYSNLIQ